MYNIGCCHISTTLTIIWIRKVRIGQEGNEPKHLKFPAKCRRLTIYLTDFGKDGDAFEHYRISLELLMQPTQIHASKSDRLFVDEAPYRRPFSQNTLS